MSTWRVDPRTGDYVMENGAPVSSDELVYPAYYRLKVPRTQWLYAPDNGYGSDFWTVRKRFNPTEVSSLTDMALKALEPMEDDGRASDIAAAFSQPFSRNDSQIKISITNAVGEPQDLILPVLPTG